MRVCCTYFYFSLCSGVRMRMTTLSRLEKLRIVLQETFLVVRGEGAFSFFATFDLLVVVTLKFVSQTVVLTKNVCLVLGQDEAGS
jgi:hypothetical protein